MGALQVPCASLANALLPGSPWPQLLGKGLEEVEGAAVWLPGHHCLLSPAGPGQSQVFAETPFTLSLHTGCFHLVRLLFPPKFQSPIHLPAHVVTRIGPQVPDNHSLFRF